MKYNILPPYQMLFSLRIFFVLTLVMCIVTLICIEEESMTLAMVSFIITIILTTITMWIKILHIASKSYQDLLNHKAKDLLSDKGFHILQQSWYSRYKSILDISGVKQVDDEDWFDWNGE